MKKRLGWTVNVAILEGCMASEERSWYFDAALRFGWTKAQLLEEIETGVWREETLDERADICYTKDKEVKVENQTDEKDPLRVSRQYLQEPNGRVRHEGLVEKSWADVAVPNCIGGYQQRGNWEPSLSAGTPQACRAWDRLRRPRSPAVHQQRLREIRPADRVDKANLRDMYRICGDDFADKIHLLMDYTNHPGEVADPWYTEDFETTWRDVLAGCQGLLGQPVSAVAQINA